LASRGRRRSQGGKEVLLSKLQRILLKEKEALIISVLRNPFPARHSLRNRGLSEGRGKILTFRKEKEKKKNFLAPREKGISRKGENHGGGRGSKNLL